METFVSEERVMPDDRPLDYVDTQGTQWVMAACGHRCGGGVSVGDRLPLCPNCRLLLALGTKIPIVYPDRVPSEIMEERHR